MRVLLLLEEGAVAVEEALVRRGHQVTMARVEALHDLSDPAFAQLDLIIADAEPVQRKDLVNRLAALTPGIEFILVGEAAGGALPADVIAQIARSDDLDGLLRYVDEVADILDGERLRAPTDLVAYETVFAGDSPPILSLVRRVRLVARSDAPVWVFGDDGSGRGIIARAIHDRSSRRNQPFVALNTAAHADEDLTRMLFEGDAAPFAQGRTGTVFLEQIESSGPQLQRALVQHLDAISARLIIGVPLADTSSRQRVLSSELYYRLKVLEVEIPRLRDRGRDLETIVGRMLARLASGGRAPTLSAETLKLLARHSFPGNLLELGHALTHAFVVAHGNPIEPHHLPQSIRAHDAGSDELQPLDTVAKRFERDYLLRVLRSVDGSRQRAAEILGISRKGLWAKLKSHEITDEELDQLEANVN